MYQLILNEPKRGLPDRDVGENVFLDDLQPVYKVYLFYYPGALPNEDLEIKLKDFGESAGKNLFVNIGRLNDPKYGKICSTFEVRGLPVIIMTGLESLAAMKVDGHFSTVYVRLDNKELFRTVDSTIKCVQRLFNLFNEGDISKILYQAKHDQSTAIISNLKSSILNVLKEAWHLLQDRDIAISFIDGKFELKRNMNLAS